MAIVLKRVRCSTGTIEGNQKIFGPNKVNGGVREFGRETLQADVNYEAFE